MNIESWAFWGAFLGAGLGLPMGFLLIEVMKFIQARKESRPGNQLAEWAMGQKGAQVIEETQIANRWVRTYDLTAIPEEPTEMQDEDDDDQPERYVELPFKYATHIIGSRDYSEAVTASNRAEAVANHAAAVNQVRKELRLIPT